MKAGADSEAPPYRKHYCS